MYSNLPLSIIHMWRTFCALWSADPLSPAACIGLCIKQNKERPPRSSSFVNHPQPLSQRPQITLVTLCANDTRRIDRLERHCREDPAGGLSEGLRALNIHKEGLAIIRRDISPFVHAARHELQNRTRAASRDEWRYAARAPAWNEWRRWRNGSRAAGADRRQRTRTYWAYTARPDWADAARSDRYINPWNINAREQGTRGYGFAGFIRLAGFARLRTFGQERSTPSLLDVVIHHQYTHARGGTN